jgi:hypothetical protein
MRRLAATALALVVAAIALISSDRGCRAQTPEQAWSTFLGDNRPDLQPNRIRIEYLEPTNKDLLLLGDDAASTLAKNSGDFQPAAITRRVDSEDEGVRAF